MLTPSHHREETGAHEKFRVGFLAAWELSGRPSQADINELFVTALDNEYPADIQLHPLWVCMRGAIDSNLPLNWLTQALPDFRQSLMKAQNLLEGIVSLLPAEQQMRIAERRDAFRKTVEILMGESLGKAADDSPEDDIL